MNPTSRRLCWPAFIWQSEEGDLGRLLKFRASEPCAHSVALRLFGLGSFPEGDVLVTLFGSAMVIWPWRLLSLPLSLMEVRGWEIYDRLGWSSLRLGGRLVLR